DASVTGVSDVCSSDLPGMMILPQEAHAGRLRIYSAWGKASAAEIPPFATPAGTAEGSVRACRLSTDRGRPGRPFFKIRGARRRRSEERRVGVDWRERG